MSAFLEKRYYDSYSAARRVSRWGIYTLIFSLIFGVLAIVVGFIALASAPATAASGITVFLGGMAIVGSGCVTNLLAKAAAHVLTTTTDTAVNTSMFMSNEAKWRALTFQRPQPDQIDIRAGSSAVNSSIQTG